jgi:PAS domain S-box-containing protein
MRFASRLKSVTGDFTGEVSQKLPYMTCWRRLILDSCRIAAFVLLFLTSPSWLGAGIDPRVSLTPEERVWLAKNPGKLTLYYNVEFPPIEFASESGAFTGMGADVVALVENRLGVTFRKVSSNDWNRHLAALKSSECAVAPTIVSTPEREKYAYFTTPYAVVPVVIIATRATEGRLSLNDLEGKTVAVVSGYATESYARERSNGSFKIMPVANVSEGLRAVAFGQADAMLENLAVASYFIEKEGIPVLRVAGNTDYVFAWSIGISREYPLLFSAIQKAMNTIDPVEMEAIRHRWISLDPASGMDPTTLRALRLTGAFTVAVLFILLMVSFVLRRKLRDKAATLETTQKDLIEQAELLRLATEATQAGVWDFRPQARTVYLSAQWFSLLGYSSPEQVLSLADFDSYVHPDDRNTVHPFYRDDIQQGERRQFEAEFRLRHFDGSWVWVLSKGQMLESDGPASQVRVIGLDLNIQTLKEAQEQIRISEERFRALFMNAPIPMAHVSAQGEIIAFNDSFTRVLGYTPEDVPDNDHWWLAAYPDAAYRKLVMESWTESMQHARADQTLLGPVEFRVTIKDGKALTMIMSASRVGDSLLVSFFDVTGERERESALQRQTELLRATFNATADGVLVVDIEGHLSHMNRRFIDMWRIPKEIQNTFEDERLLTYAAGQMEDPTAFLAKVRTLYQSTKEDFEEIRFTDGRVFERYSCPMMLDGHVIGRVWDFRDITQRKRAEEERGKLQEQLLQSQKLEAVGVLAGGVAHDFNNILSAIIGYTELSLNSMGPIDPNRSNLDKILDAARRSADLTRQLLAFARKQTVAPIVLDLNESVSSVLKMIRRIIGENIGLIWRPESSPCPVLMDPSQLDQILLNLCVNARDAIATIGVITIETRAVELGPSSVKDLPDAKPGPYIVLSVSDNGCGMDAGTLERIFDPFFTTKGVGLGTGMGCATVYGIVKQNEGFIDVQSRSGEGTIFHIYLPRHLAPMRKAPGDRQADSPGSRGETLLLIEDEPTILEMTTMMLQHLGYASLSAATPGEAMKIAREHPSEIHLILTDVVMPEMNGRDLVDRLTAVRPGLKVLFMSGYTADVIADQGVLDANVNFIHKPFSIQELAVKIREILDT